jgi:hypothetical protein
MNFTLASLAQRTTDNLDRLWHSQVSEVRLSVANWHGESPERALLSRHSATNTRTSPQGHVAILARRAAGTR